ncbi:MAG: glycerol kinase GlpK [Myxococcota bacterium]
MPGYILSIDQGTTGSTAAVLSADDASVLGKANQEFPQHYPESGWVEHDLGEIWASVTASIAGALKAAKVSEADCRAIGITNQRETTVVWDRKTGEPIHRAIVWQDRRTADGCAKLKADGLEAKFRERTGLVLDPYFSGTKVAWILDAVDGASSRAASLAFGTIDSWLVWKLSGGAAHVTDVTNASRTLLYDIRDGQWNEELCRLLNVPMELLPAVKPCAGTFAETRGVPGLPDGVPITGIAGDQQAALFGQTCFLPGDAKCTYGTGAFLLMNTGERFVPSSHGLLTTIAWELGETTTYALEGSAFIAGAAVQWLRDGLGLIQDASEIESKAREVQSAGDVVFVPALAGLGAPHWDPHARGLIYGLTRDTTVAHLCRATLDGIALQIADLLSAMKADSATDLSRLRVDGGASRNNLLMQFQADVLGVAVDRPVNVETTALGAAYLAGLGAGIFSNQEAIVNAHRIEQTFDPQMDDDARTKQLSRWNAAVRRAKADQEAS